MPGAKNWCLTLNNYSNEEFERLKNYECIYSILGEEVGASGTPHIQGYFEFKSTKELSVLKCAFPKGHWEIRKGTGDQASEYCKKDNKFVEHGTKKKQGKRTDLIAVANSVVNKTFTPEDYPEEYIKYSKGIGAFSASLQKHRTAKPNVIWRWGLSGTGKTHVPYTQHINSVYIKDGTQWWDGYDQQEAIIIDDFDGKWPFRDLLRLLDCYPYQGQFKGGYHKINSPYIYITCEFPPSKYWKDNTLKQIERRCVQIVEVKSEVESVVVGNTIQPQVI